MITTIKKIYYHPRISDDLTMIYQLRMNLCTYVNISTDGTRLYCDDEYYELLNHRLVKRPGTLIYIQDIDDLAFYQNDLNIYLYYRRGGNEYEIYLCQAS